MATKEQIILFGQDIALDRNMVAMTAANGDALVVDGIATALQDIKLRLFTPLGSLFYDKEFGSLIHLFIQDENSRTNRMALVSEVQYRVELDPRVEPQSCRASVISWDHLGIVVKASFNLINVTNPFNLIITVDSDKQTVIDDVDTY